MSDSSWSSGRRNRRPTNRVIEVATVLLLGLATVASAWSAFQVSQWNGVETDEARVSAAHRIQSSRDYGQATQIVAYDAAIVGQYAQAVTSDNENLQEFFKATLIRPGFLPELERWEAEIAAGGTPTNLLEDDDYLEALFAASTAEDELAAAASARSEDAGAKADDYIRLTLFFAAALFFAGVTASFSTPFTKIILLAAATCTLVFAGAQLISYPVA